MYRLEITSELLVQLFEKGHIIKKTECIEGLPKGCRIDSIIYDSKWKRHIIFLYEPNEVIQGLRNKMTAESNAKIITPVYKTIEE